MGRLRMFPNKVRDVRVQRIHLNGNLIQCNPQQHYNVTLFPMFHMWVQRIGLTISVDKASGQEFDMCTTGLMLRFLFWTVDIFDYSYLRPHREAWAEDGKRRYISSWADYARKQKH